MSVSRTIDIFERPYTTLKEEMKALKKEAAEAKKAVEEADKAGQKASQTELKRIQDLDKKYATLSNKMKVDGAKLRFQERMNAQAADNRQNYNVGGMINDQINSKVQGFIGSENVQAVLNNRKVNAATGGMAKEFSNTAMTQGWRAAVGGVAAPIAVGVAAFTALPLAIGKGMAVTNHYSEEFRTSQADYRVKVSDTNYINPIQRELDAAKNRGKVNSQDSLGQVAGSSLAKYVAVGYAAQLANFIRNRREGTDAYSTRGMERDLAVQQSKISLNHFNKESIVDVARNRVYADRYGSAAVGAFMQYNPVSRLYEKIVGDNTNAEAITNQIKTNISRFNQFTEEGDQRAMNMDFVGAAASYEEAKKEIGTHALPDSKNWRNPTSVWTAKDNAVKAQINYGFSISGLPPIRLGQ